MWDNVRKRTPGFQGKKTPMAHQVFISYSSVDAAIAERMCAALESAAISCWIAPRDVQPGTDYPAAIVDALASSIVVVLVLTEHAVASPHILTEIGHAFNVRKRIVPFRIASVPLSKDLDYFLSMAQWLDARDGCTDENLKQLVGAVKSALQGEVPVKPAPRQLPGRNVRLLALAGLVLLGLGAVAYWKWPQSSAVTTRITNSTKDTVSKVEGASKTDSPAKTDTVGKVEAPDHVAKTWLNPADGEEYVWIPSGTFTMGCSAGDSQCADDERPAHLVEIEKGFWLARTETTIGAYRKPAGRNGVKAPQGDANLPVSGVTWAEAKAYCAGVGGRLPSEAEWEYAARGGQAGAYYGVVPAIAWYADNSGGVPHAAGTKKPNAYGLFDMLGNVSEWVLDRYYNKYDLTSPAAGAGIEQPLASNASAVARGGFWDGDAATVRVSHRAAYPNDDAEPIVGFRCANDRI